MNFKNDAGSINLNISKDINKKRLKETTSGKLNLQLVKLNFQLKQWKKSKAGKLHIIFIALQTSIVFNNHSSLKSELFLKPIHLSGFTCFKAQSFENSGFSGSIFFRVRVLGPV